MVSAEEAGVPAEENCCGWAGDDAGDAVPHGADGVAAGQRRRSANADRDLRS